MCACVRVYFCERVYVFLLACVCVCACVCDYVIVSFGSVLLSSGEVLVGRAPNTCLLLFSAESIDTKQSEGVCGTLFITNHRLMFRPNPFTTSKVSKRGCLCIYQSLCFQLRPVDQLSVESSANVPLGVIHAIYSSKLYTSILLLYLCSDFSALVSLLCLVKLLCFA